jgi:hypothetical protein
MLTIVGKVETVSLRLREIVGANGKGVITDWLSKEGGARAKFHVRIGNLRLVPRADWNKKQFHKLRDANDVCEIKWKSGDRQWCALGFDKDNYFLMLLGCTHKDEVYGPRNCIETAKFRKREVEDGKRTIIDYQE